MYNPYQYVDFANIEHIHGVSHKHCVTADQYAHLQSNGIRHLAISNYYPSKPVYPLSDYFTPFAGAIQCPNAEQHNVTNPFGVSVRLHLNGIGSLCQSGSPRGETPVGMNGIDWRRGIDQILGQLLYTDGGGITINHPIWTGLTAKHCCAILDYDARILGIEAYNQSTEEEYHSGNAISIWDEILKTGRRCYGFFAPDWADETIRGRNVLLSDASERGCLNAYRTGAFYGKIGTTDFRFTGISYNSGVLRVSVDRPAALTVITDTSTDRITGTSAEMPIDPDEYVYVRVEAHSPNDDDTVYTQPIMLDKPGKEITDDAMSFPVALSMFD